MDSYYLVDLVRESTITALWVSAPVLVVGMIVALAMATLQALTQLQEQTVAFVPKLFAMMFVLAMALPWVIDQLVNYTRELIQNIPGSL